MAWIIRWRLASGATAQRQQMLRAQRGHRYRVRRMRVDPAQFGDFGLRRGLAFDRGGPGLRLHAPAGLVDGIVLEYAEELGIGSRAYRLTVLD